MLRNAGAGAGAILDGLRGCVDLSAGAGGCSGTSGGGSPGVR